LIFFAARSIATTSLSNVPKYATPPTITAEAAVYAPAGIENTSRPSLMRTPWKISSQPPKYAMPSAIVGVACT
jgi:hypothetical protein